MTDIVTFLANLRGTIETEQQVRKSDLFKSMEIAGFDPAHPIKVRKSDELLICGYHRVRCAKLLGLKPVEVRINCTDEEALQIAVLDNTYTAPITIERRRAIARELYPAHTQQALAGMLGVSQKTISVWLRDLIYTQGINQTPRKTTGNPKGAGRPKAPPKPKPIPLTPEQQRAARRHLDEGVTMDKAAAEAGFSSTVMRRVKAAVQAERETVERMAAAQAEAREVAHAKAEHAMIKHLRETVGRQSRQISALEKKIKELEARELPEITPEEKKELTAYRRKIRHELHTEYKSRIAHNDARLAEARRIHGCMTPFQFNTILKAVRRDMTASEDTMREAQETMLKFKDVLLGQPAPVKQNGRAQTPMRRSP